MAGKKNRRFIFNPIDGKWSREVFQPYETGLLLSFTHQADESDYHMAYASLLDELAARAIEEREILDDVIAALGRHMRVFPRVSMGMPLAILGMERLLGEKNEAINQKIIDHANDLDVERQVEIYRLFKPDTRNEEDRILAEQVNLLDVQEKYGFKPKFYIGESSLFDDVPAFLDIENE